MVRITIVPRPEPFFQIDKKPSCDIVICNFSIDFGVIMAVRGLMQIPVMFTIIALQGKLHYCLFFFKEYYRSFCADFLLDF